MFKRVESVLAYKLSISAATALTAFLPLLLGDQPALIATAS